MEAVVIRDMGIEYFVSYYDRDVRRELSNIKESMGKIARYETQGRQVLARANFFERACWNRGLTSLIGGRTMGTLKDLRRSRWMAEDQLAASIAEIERHVEEIVTALTGINNQYISEDDRDTLKEFVNDFERFLAKIEGLKKFSRIASTVSEINRIDSLMEEYPTSRDSYARRIAEIDRIAEDSSRKFDEEVNKLALYSAFNGTGMKIEGV